MKGFNKGMIAAVILLAALAAIWLVLRQDSSKPAMTDQQQLLRRLLYTYAQEQDPASAQIEGILEKMEAGETWQKILLYWEKATNQMPLFYECVPDSLETDGSLCLIVLGYQLNSDGSMQEELVGRLETALLSARKYPNSYLLCTGGGTASAAPGITEADAMAQWLMAQGIEKERILVENQSLTTAQNAQFSSRILAAQHPEIQYAAIVSSDYHIPWGSLLFQAQFLLAEQPIQVVCNAAYRTGTTLHPSTLLRYQLSGLLTLGGIA